jgi:hypothetical protein
MNSFTSHSEGTVLGILQVQSAVGLEVGLEVGMEVGMEVGLVDGKLEGVDVERMGVVGTG